MDKFIKIFSVVGIILFSFRCISAQTRVFTIEESIATGIENSNELKVSQSKIISSKAKVNEVKSQYYPQLKFNASYLRQSYVDPYLIIVPFSETPLQISEVLLNNYNFRLSLQQQIFTGFKLSSLKNSGEFAVKSSESEYNNEKNNVASAVLIAYWNYYKTKFLKKTADDNLALTEKHLRDTRNFLINGLATKSDLLKMEVQNSNAKLQQLEADNNTELARISFNKVLGLNLEENTDIETDIPEPVTESLNLEDLLNEAYGSRSELKAMNYKLKSLQENINSVKSQYYPSVYLGANFYYANPNLRIQPPHNEFDETWDAGITLSWDVFNWGYTSSQVSQSQQIYNQNKTGYDQLKDNISLEVNQNYYNVNYLKERISVSRKAVEQAEENYRVIQEKYNQQLSTSTDLVDAENSLLQAKTNLIITVTDYRISVVKLYRSTGRKLY